MRPSLAGERRAEILDTIEACIRDIGIHALTTQHIAERSGYSRSHVRHYLGNKDDQLRALVDRYADRYARSLEDLLHGTEPGERRECVVRELFGETWLFARPEDDAVLDQLNSYVASNPGNGGSLAPMYERIIAVVFDCLAAVTNDEDARTRAQLVVSLAFGTSTLHRLGVVDHRRAVAHARDLMLLPSASGSGALPAS